MDDSASPRKPRVPMRKRSSADFSLLVACASEGEGQVFGDDAAAVVHDADEFSAAGFKVDVDAGGAGIDRVFQQFLDDGRGPLDDLAGGNLRDDPRRKLINTRHEASMANSAAVGDG